MGRLLYPEFALDWLKPLLTQAEPPGAFSLLFGAEWNMLVIN